eukprot:5242976-Prymnesium_polylepis.1
MGGHGAGAYSPAEEEPTGGAMEWPHSNRRKNDPPAFGAQGPGTSSMAAARGAFKCHGPRRRAHRSPAVVAHNKPEKMHRGWPQKREPRVQTPRAQVGGKKGGHDTVRCGAVRCGAVRCGAV